MHLVHFVIHPDTGTTVLCQITEVHRQMGKEPTLVLREVDSGVIHADVSTKSIFPAYPMKNIY